jgi:hypothetical protein
MSVLLLVMTDGRRDCIKRTIPSLEEHLQGNITRRVVHDDSGDEDYRDWLVGKFDDYEVIFHPEGRQGFGGAYRNAWRFLTGAREPFVFSTEDDFIFGRTVDLDAMRTVLALRPHLTQLALRRQPWNAEELAAGGVIEQHPDDYTDMVGYGGKKWLEHRLFFTTNPSLFRRRLCLQGWPDVEHSEGHFSLELFGQNPKTTCGFWGGRSDGPWVTHIGDQRVGTGY